MRPGRAVVAAAHFPVAQLGAQRGRQLKIGAHLQDAVARAARRDDREGLREARLVSFEILGGFVVERPAAHIAGQLGGIFGRRCRNRGGGWLYG